MDNTTSISDTTNKLVALIAKCCTESKLQPSELRYNDFKKWLKVSHNLGRESMVEVERYIASVGGFISMRNAFFVASASANQIQALEIKSIAGLGKVANDVLARQDLFLARLSDRMSAVLKAHAHYKPFGYSVLTPKAAKRAPKVGRVLNLALSDLHFGTNPDKREVPAEYGFTQEARRLAEIIRATCNFKRDYREETELNVWMGGDLIKGLIHDITAGLALADQVADAVWLLRQALILLAGEFRKVTVYCSSGNHDRNVVVHKDRATTGKWDSYATHIYIALKAAVAHLPNISVCIPRTPHVEYTTFPGQRTYATHGDTCLDAGNPGKSINIGRLEQQMLRINSGEVQRGHEPYGLFVVGHVHVGSLTRPAAGVIITNGCLTPPDPYAVSIGYSTCQNGQYLWETTPKYLVGDSRFLGVDESTDRDASLDKLIIPYSGEF